MRRRLWCSRVRNTVLNTIIETVSIGRSVTIKLWTFMEDLQIQNECVIHTCTIYSV